jgi:hypothetical protein
MARRDDEGHIPKTQPIAFSADEGADVGVDVIDGANLHATSKALGFDIDFKRLLALFREKGQLVRALYYTALIVLDPAFDRLARLQWLHGGDEGGEGVHRCLRSAQGKGQYGH